VCDCNYLAWVIATRDYVRLQKKETWLCLCACKATWWFGIWLQTWVASDCKKLKCLIAESAGLFLWLQKKEKEKLNKCAIPTIWRAWFQQRVTCDCIVICLRLQ
jgi:hypothetical protein